MRAMSEQCVVEVEGATARPRPCRRCKQADGVHTLRDDPTCNDCFIKYVSTKAVKRLGAMNRELNREQQLKEPNPSQTADIPKYAVGLSLGPSSASLLQILHSNLLDRQSRNSKATYELLAVHVNTDDDDASSEAHNLLLKWRARFPHVQFSSVQLSPGRSEGWQTLLGPAPGSGSGSVVDKQPPSHTRDFLSALPSATSRADLLQKMVLQQLAAWAADQGCSALLLGHSTTALSELALAEVAKGRGFGVSWLLNDGLVSLSPEQPAPFPVYRPFREVFRGEAVTYTTLVTPSLEDLLIKGPESGALAVVSHRDVSIEQVMCRYFDETEKHYPSIVANVAKTIGKLTRPHHDAPCKVCALPLDNQGEARWQGEIGVAESARGPDAPDICYGCKRSLYG